MKKYWCVNFDEAENLRHGIEHRCWIMGYQYPLRGEASPSNKARITRNWRRLSEIEKGDEFVAYLKPNLFFATGTVTTPHRKKLSTDKSNSIEQYLERKKSYSKGFIYFTDVVYENFTDEIPYYPVRIDVDLWTNFRNEGVSTKVLGSIPPNEIQVAAFKISKSQFLQISRDLANGESSGCISIDKPAIFQNLKKTSKVTEPKLVITSGQGILLDPVLRKKIEDYSMSRAIKHFKSKKYKVYDRSKNSSFDLECVKENTRLFVEVKGTQGNGKNVFLTAKEVEFANNHSSKMVLFVVHSIEVKNGNLSEGVDVILQPWKIGTNELSPFASKYKVPS